MQFNATNTLTFPESWGGECTSFDLISSSVCVNGIVSWFSGICKFKVEKACSLVLAYLSSNAKRFARKLVILDCGSLGPVKDFSDRV